jgi:hypothetical protein
LTDFLQPGCDGSLQADINEWLRGIVYTGRPGIPSVLQPGQEYRITVASKQRIAARHTFAGYGHLYQRVTAIANARVSQLTCACEEEHLHPSILLRGCSRHESCDIATAFLTMGLASFKQSDAKPKGPNPLTPQQADEAYNEFDFSDLPGDTTHPFMVSYGESVQVCEGIDFEPFVKRAEAFTRFYHGLLGESTAPLRIIRRRWYCVTHPNLVTVEILMVRSRRIG